MVRSLILLAAAVALPAAAQDYPAREIRSICNFSAGSGADIIVRYYSDRLSKLAGKPVVVENRPGVQGALASDFVAKSKPDGYTLMITPASSTIATAPHIFKKLPFDPVKDFASVTTINSLAFVLAVDAAGPIQSVPDLIAHLKQKSNHGFYGTGSNSGQVAAELFKEYAGLRTTYVPYKVTTDALTGLLLGQVAFISYDATWAVTQAGPGGKLRVLAATSAKRSAALPNVPTLQELGYKDFNMSSEISLLGPKGTPKQIVSQLNAELNKSLQSAEVRERLASLGGEPEGGPPEHLAERVRSDLERWGKVIRDAKVAP